MTNVIPNPDLDIQTVEADVLRTTGSASFGVTTAGFVPKPFARLLAERLTMARAILGDDVDLTSTSVLRKLLEISALEDARTWAALAAMYDNSFVATAAGSALGVLGAELGLPRPFLEASGSVTLTLTGTLPSGTPSLRIPAGSRMLTASGGHDAATGTDVVLSPADPTRVWGSAPLRPGRRETWTPPWWTVRCTRSGWRSGTPWIPNSPGPYRGARPRRLGTADVALVHGPAAGRRASCAGRMYSPARCSPRPCGACSGCRLLHRCPRPQAQVLGHRGQWMMDQFIQLRPARCAPCSGRSSALLRHLPHRADLCGDLGRADGACDSRPRAGGATLLLYFFRRQSCRGGQTPRTPTW